MKQILFTRHHFNQICALKRQYTILHIKLFPYQNEPRLSSLRQFLLFFESEMNDFISSYDELKKRINTFDKDLSYFNEETTELGLLCLNKIDSIGKAIDILLEEIIVKDFLEEEPLTNILFW